MELDLSSCIEMRDKYEIGEYITSKKFKLHDLIGFIKVYPHGINQHVFIYSKYNKKR